MSLLSTTFPVYICYREDQFLWIAMKCFSAEEFLQSTLISHFSSSLPLYFIYMNARGSYNRIGRSVILHFWIGEKPANKCSRKIHLNIEIQDEIFFVASYSTHYEDHCMVDRIMIKDTMESNSPYSSILVCREADKIWYDISMHTRTHVCIV